MAAKAVKIKAAVVRGGKKPQLREASKKDFVKARREAFLDALAQSCNVRLAARTVGVCTSVVYKWRRKDAGFRAAWRAALAEAYQGLELVLLERAIKGEVKVVKRAGGSERLREYPNALALQLLRLHKDSIAADEAAEAHDPDAIDEVRRRIMRKLDAVKKRIETKAAADAEPEEEAQGAA